MNMNGLAHSTRESLEARPSWMVICGLWLIFVSGIFWSRFSSSTDLRNALYLWAAASLIALAIAWMKNGRAAPVISVSIRTPHYVQMCVQGSVFVYWGWYWPPVYEYVPLILSQVIFAYLVELAVCWFKYGKWRIGFGPWPIVFSTNLFMWFVDTHFWVQYVLIALAYLSREWLRWKKDGVESHIFNPSAFGLCVISLILIATGQPHLTHGEEISITLGYPPFAYEWIFVAGLVVQFFFGVTMVTMSAAVTSWVLGIVYLNTTGAYMYVDTTIPIAVFLGMNLLVTDPASSPKSHGGKFLFGALYGIAIFFMYAVLRDAGTPAIGEDPGFSIAWMDKLLFLPFLNLLAHPIDRIGRHLHFGALGTDWNWMRVHSAHIGVWCIAFFLLLPGFKDHPGTLDFWTDACESEVRWACENELILHKVECETGNGGSCSKVATAHRHGEHLPKDLIRAGGYQVRGCSLGSSESCDGLMELGFNLRMSFPDIRGQELAQECFITACDSGIKTGCWAANCQLGEAPFCTQLADAYRLGRAVKKSPQRALELYGISCTLGYDLGCIVQGTMLFLGDGVPQDRKQGEDIIQGACTSGSDRACAQLNRLKSRQASSRGSRK